MASKRNRTIESYFKSTPVRSEPANSAPKMVKTETEVKPELVEDKENFKTPAVPASKRPLELSSVATPAAQPTFSSCSVKNGRVVLAEKKLSLELHPETVKSLADFHSWLATQTESISEFPAQFQPLLALLVEDSDQTLASLSSRLFGRLVPSVFDVTSAAGSSQSEQQPILNQKTLQASILTLCERKNYGIPQSTAVSNGSAFRWEVLNLDLLPESLHAMIKERRETRQLAHERITEWWDALNDADKEAMTSRKRRKTSETPLANHQLPGSSATKTSKQERDDQKRLAKEAKEQEKLEREQAREEERVKKEEERRLREEEKLKRDEQKRAEREAKAEAKRIANEKKEAARLAKEEEERKREEKRLKQEKSITGFLKLFRRDTKSSPMASAPKPTMSEFELTFPQFHVRQNVTLAKCTLPNRKLTAEFDIELFKSTDVSATLSDMKKNASYAAAIPHGAVSIELASQVKRTTVKLLQFHENYRPPFFGTWNKNSAAITARNPLKQDTGLLDYEYDSDDEWEEEEEGDECLSDEEEDEECMSEAADEDEEGWLVPDGHLSEDEGVDDEEKDTSLSGSVLETPVGAKAKKDMPRKKLEQLQSIIVGPLFQTRLDESVHAPFASMRVIMLQSVPMGVNPLTVVLEATPKDQTEKSATPQRQKKTLPAHLLVELVKMVHGSSKGIDKLVDEFRQIHEKESLPKSLISNTIRDIAVKERRNNNTKMAWYVKDKNMSGMDLGSETQIIDAPSISHATDAIPLPTPAAHIDDSQQ